MRTIDGVDGRIITVEQTLLPDVLTTLRIETVDQLIDAIKRLAIRGAPALGVAGALGVALAAVKGGDVRAEATRLRAARPTAVNLAWGVDRVLARGDAQDLSDAFWVSLQAAWFTAHTETVVRPLLSAGFDVLVDGWLYKFFAKLFLQGFTEPDLAVIFDRVQMPDSVLLLQADVGAVYDRRSDFRPAELGMHAGYGDLDDLNRGTFIDYQTRTAFNLQMLADRHGWSIAHLDPDEPIPATADRLAPIIAELRTSPVSAPVAGSARNGEVLR